jgi:uncharacterized protein
MAGTKIGGLKAAAKNKERNPNFYKEIALKAQESWARNGRLPRGFSARPDIAVTAGSKGGSISRRKSKKV